MAIVPITSGEEATKLTVHVLTLPNKGKKLKTFQIGGIRQHQLDPSIPQVLGHWIGVGFNRLI
jgi:hypothetical protein